MDEKSCKIEKTLHFTHFDPKKTLHQWVYKCISATITVHICTIIVALAFNILHFFLSLSPHSLIFSSSLSPLAMLEDSVKKLRSPKTSPRLTLSKTRIDCVLDFLTDWVFESCGSVSFSSLKHPKSKLS